MKFLKKLDINGYVPKFNFRSVKSRKSFLGAFITIIMIIIYINLFLHFGHDFFYKLNPKGFFQQFGLYLQMFFLLKRQYL